MIRVHLDLALEDTTRFYMDDISIWSVSDVGQKMYGTEYGFKNETTRRVSWPCLEVGSRRLMTRRNT